MENESFSQRAAGNGSWLGYLLIILVAVACFIVLNLANIGGSSTKRDVQAEALEAIQTGDSSIREALAPVGRPVARDKVSEAISSFQEAGKWPGALRRIVIAKESLLGKTAKPEIDRLASQGSKYAAEADMWRSIYGNEKLPSKTAGQYVSRVEQLSTGPLRDVAISSIYKRAGESTKAKAAMDKAHGDALFAAAAKMLLVTAVVGAGLVGIGLGLAFLIGNIGKLRSAPRARIQPTVLLISFLVYLVGYQLFSLILSLAMDALGLTGQSTAGLATQLLFDLVAMFGSLAASLAAFYNMTARTGEDPRQIGLYFRPVAGKIAWGVGAYCAALPLVGLSAIVTQWLVDHVFRHVQTPEHPIVPIVSQGGWALLMSFVVAVVAAPIVEETAFRGMLYTAFRGRMGVWVSAVITSALFSALHPTFPGQFLPLFALGMVLAIVREKTGSLLPGMACHALNNLVSLLMVVVNT